MTGEFEIIGIGYNIDGESRRFNLNKGGHTYVLRYSPRSVSLVKEALLDWANNQKLNFSHFDAALMIYEIGRRIDKEASE